MNKNCVLLEDYSIGIRKRKDGKFIVSVDNVPYICLTVKEIIKKLDEIIKERHND